MFDNLVTMRSIYLVVSKIGDFDMKEDILNNILREKNYQKDSRDQYTFTSTIREYIDKTVVLFMKDVTVQML